jgi:hypothetical protein
VAAEAVAEPIEGARVLGAELLESTGLCALTSPYQVSLVQCHEAPSR